MSFQLAKVPLGFLELLRARTLGRAPTSCSDELQPVLDLRPFYACDIQLVTSSAPSLGALPISDVLTFTSNLGVRAVGTQLTVGAAPVTAGGNLEVGIIVGGVQQPIGAHNFGVAAAGTVVGFGTPIDPAVFRAGVQFYAKAYGTAAGADHAITIRVLIENYTSQN